MTYIPSDESIEMMKNGSFPNYEPVKVIKDNDGHWYIIPNHLLDEFNEDLNNEYLVDSGEFDNEWGEYRTGGNLNNIQLYIKK